QAAFAQLDGGEATGMVLCAATDGLRGSLQGRVNFTSESHGLALLPSIAVPVKGRAARRLEGCLLLQVVVSCTTRVADQRARSLLRRCAMLSSVRRSMSPTDSPSRLSISSAAARAKSSELAFRAKSSHSLRGSFR